MTTKPVIVDVTGGGAVRGGSVPANPFASRSRNGAKITGLVYHHSGSIDLAGAMTAGQKPGKQHGTSAQFYIDRDGTIYEYAPESSRQSNIRSPGSPVRTDFGAATARLSNSNVIGVEIIAPDSDHMTKEQINAALQLGGYLADEYSIAPDMIVGHGELQGGPGGNKQPGEGVNVASLMRKQLLGVLPPEDIPGSGLGDNVKVATTFRPLPAPEPLTPASMAASLAWQNKTEQPLSPGLMAIAAATGGTQRTPEGLAYIDDVPTILPASENLAGGYDLRNAALYGVRRAPGAAAAVIPPMTPGQEYSDPRIPGIVADPRLADLQKPTGAVVTKGSAATGFNTVLSPKAEAAFQQWKAAYAPNDSGQDYDYRGAFAAGVQPDPQTGHWPDTFKKPGNPTFSNESQYAPMAPALAGHWEGDTYIPPPARPTTVDVGKEPPRILDITGRPPPAPGVTVEPKVETLANGRPVIEVGGGVTPTRAPILTPPTPTPATMFTPSPVGTDTRDWSITLPRNVSEALQSTALAAAGAGMDQHFNDPKNIGGVDASKALGDIHDKRDAAQVAAAPPPAPRVSDTLVAPQKKEVQTITIHAHIEDPAPTVTPKQKSAINDVSMIPDQVLHPPAKPQGPVQPQPNGPPIVVKVEPRLPADNQVVQAPLRVVSRTVVNPAYEAWMRDYGSNAIAPSPEAMAKLEDIHDKRDAATIAAQQGSPKPVSPVVPPPPPRFITEQVPVQPRQRPIDSGGGNYTIQSGDTLSAIARRNGTTVAEIARANGIADVNKINAGDRLVIPPPSKQPTNPNAPAPKPKPPSNNGTPPGGPIYVDKKTGQRMVPTTKVMFNPDTGDFEPRTIYVPA